MEMPGDIRVHTERKHGTLYKGIKKHVINEMRDFFFLCACLGYLKDERKPLSKDKELRFRSYSIPQDEYISYYAMLVESNKMDFSLTNNGGEVIAVIEEYANAGLDILLDDILLDFVVDNSKEPQLNSIASGELPKLLLAYLYEEILDLQA